MRFSKYKAQPVVIDGIRFASRAEAGRYLQLKDMQERGVIKSLTLQPKYTLAADIIYRADFAYDAQIDSDWVRVVEDVKGMETSAFKLKRRLFEYAYQMPLTVIKMKAHEVNKLLAKARVC